MRSAGLVVVLAAALLEASVVLAAAVSKRALPKSADLVQSQRMCRWNGFGCEQIIVISRYRDPAQRVERDLNVADSRQLHWFATPFT